MILKLAGKKISDFNSISIDLKYNSVGSTFSFQYRHDINDEDLKTLNSPDSYAECSIEYQNPDTQETELLITGIALSHGYDDSPIAGLNSISGYSKTAVLEDCEIPTTLYPLQSDGKSFKQIIENLIKPFGLNLIISEDVQGAANSVYPVSTADAGDTIKSYLATIANQKNILLSHDSQGNLLLTKSRAGAQPKYNFIRQLPVTKFTLTVDGQRMHSIITAIKQADSDGGNAGQASVTNPYVKVFRPRTILQSSGTDNDTSSVAKSTLADELRAINLDIEVDTWTDEFGKLWQPNTVISVQNDEINLPKKTLFFIETVNFSGNESLQTAVLRCVLPEVHNGQTPKNIFM